MDVAVINSKEPIMHIINVSRPNLDDLIPLVSTNTDTFNKLYTEAFTTALWLLPWINKTVESDSKMDDNNNLNLDLDFNDKTPEKNVERPPCESFDICVYRKRLNIVAGTSENKNPAIWKTHDCQNIDFPLPNSTIPTLERLCTTREIIDGL